MQKLQNEHWHAPCILMRDMKRMIAVFRDQSQACRAASDLEARGIARDQISLLTSAGASGQLFLSRYQASNHDADQPISIGSTGSMTGRAFAASQAMFVGPIGRALLRSKADSLRHALITLGIPASHATSRSAEIADGAVLVSMDTEEGTAEARAIHTALTDADQLYLASPDAQRTGRETTQRD